MAEYTTTPNRGLIRPVIGEANWGLHLQELIDQLDAGKFVAAPGNDGTKMYYGITNVVFANVNHVQAGSVSFPAPFTSTTSYVVLCTADPSQRPVLVGAEYRTASSFAPRADTSDGLLISATIPVLWLAVGT